jgi:hypothetical protein
MVEMSPLFVDVASEVSVEGSSFHFIDLALKWQQLETRIDQWRDRDDRIGKYSRLVGEIIARGRLDAFSAVGMATTEEDKLSIHTDYLHSFAGRSSELHNIWGTTNQSHTDALQIVPSDTDVFYLTALDGTALWQLVDGVLTSDFDVKTREKWTVYIERSREEKEIDYASLVGSIKGRVGLMARFDTNRQAVFYWAGDVIQIAEPQLATYLEVRTPEIYNALKSFFEFLGGVEEVTRDKHKRLVLPMPPLPFLRLEPALIGGTNFVLFASNSEWAQQTIDVKQGRTASINSSREFQQLAKKAPDAAQAWCYVSSDASREVADFIGQLNAIFSRQIETAEQQKEDLVSNSELGNSGDKTPSEKKEKRHRKTRTSTRLFWSHLEEYFADKPTALSVREARHQGYRWTTITNTRERLGLRLLQLVGESVALSLLEWRQGEDALEQLDALRENDPVAQEGLQEIRARIARMQREVEYLQAREEWLLARRAYEVQDWPTVGRYLQRSLIQLDEMYQEYRSKNVADWRREPPPPLRQLLEEDVLLFMPQPPVPGVRFVAPRTWQDFPTLDPATPPTELAAYWFHPDDPGSTLAQRIQRDLLLIDLAYKRYAESASFDSATSPVLSFDAMTDAGYFQRVPQPPLDGARYTPPADWNTPPHIILPEAITDANGTPVSTPTVWGHPDDAPAD